jgi:hypothetical protein
MDAMKADVKDAGDKMKAAVENPKPVSPDTAKAMKEKGQ